MKAQRQDDKTAIWDERRDFKAKEINEGPK